MNCRHKDEIIFAFAGLCAVFAGVLNGFIGTGGGVIIYFILKKLCRSDTKKAFATVTLTALPVTALSAAIYENLHGGVFTLSLPYLIPAVLGGVCGAALLCRVKTGAIKAAFSLMLVVSGALILFR
ncbi:MAG: sulfite exporter TauE/SafE family protein [Clostridia bacterium]|nr:sulfite exporter TauE/SafE family protein [Clostridia bacterium]